MGLRVLNQGAEGPRRWEGGWYQGHPGSPGRSLSQGLEARAPVTPAPQPGPRARDLAPLRQDSAPLCVGPGFQATPAAAVQGADGSGQCRGGAGAGSQAGSLHPHPLPPVCSAPCRPPGWSPHQGSACSGPGGPSSPRGASASPLKMLVPGRTAHLCQGPSWS